MKVEKCPCCPNHCSKDNLGCRRGIEHFNSPNNSSAPKSLCNQVIIDLRKCGHLLHHNKELNTDELLSNFSEEELNKLHKLLSKIYNHT